MVTVVALDCLKKYSEGLWSESKACEVMVDFLNNSQVLLFELGVNLFGGRERWRYI